MGLRTHAAAAAATAAGAICCRLGISGRSLSTPGDCWCWSWSSSCQVLVGGGRCGVGIVGRGRGRVGGVLKGEVIIGRIHVLYENWNVGGRRDVLGTRALWRQRLVPYVLSFLGRTGVGSHEDCWARARRLAESRRRAKVGLGSTQSIYETHRRNKGWREEERGG
jgi:hypothetical protein